MSNGMPSVPSFVILCEGASLKALDLGSGLVTGKEPLVLEETERVEFIVTQPASGMEYILSIGDVPAAAMPEDSDERVEIGVRRFGTVGWAERAHFESCRGRTPLVLRKRRIGSTGGGDALAAIDVVVVPTKISAERYEVMFEQLYQLGSDLVFDWVSKSRRLVAPKVGPGLHARPSLLQQVEFLGQLWRSVASQLERIAENPAVSTTRHFEPRLCWGNERLTPRSIRKLATVGLVPHHPRFHPPFRGEVMRLSQKPAPEEHRVVLGILAAFHDRAADCSEAIEDQIASIEVDRPYRDVRLAGQPSLYETQDQPRLQRLKTARQKLRSIQSGIDRARDLDIFRGLRAVRRIPQSPLFLENARYRALRDAFSRLDLDFHPVSDQGVEERVKETSRMYEHWVFLQIVSAFRQEGFATSSVTGLVRRRGARRRVISLGRSTGVEFECGAERRLVIRYEPWILNREDAVQKRESVYRSVPGSSAWSPDVLIEVISGTGTPEGAPRVEYAVVLDAKYRPDISSTTYDQVSKYLSIRGTADDAQVVRQLWIVHPGAHQGIWPRETFITWTADGPSRPRTETVVGRVAALPEDSHVQAEPMRTVEGQTASVFREFARGLRRYLGIRGSLHSST